MGLMDESEEWADPYFVDHPPYLDELRAVEKAEPLHYLGFAMSLAYDADKPIDVNISVEKVRGYDGRETEAAIFRAGAREADDFYSLFFEITPQTDEIRIEWRYAPAEKLSLRLYYQMRGLEERSFPIGEYDVEDEYHLWRLDVAKILAWFGEDRDQIEEMRLAFFFPRRKWSALGLIGARQIIYAREF